MSSRLVQSVQTPALLHPAPSCQPNDNTRLIHEQALTLLDSLPLLIYLVDWPTRQIIYSNSDAASFFAHFQTSDGTGLDAVEARIHPADRQVYRELLARLNRAEDPVTPTTELRLRDHRREWRWSLCRVMALSNTPCVLFCFEDITPHKTLEEQLRKQCYLDALTGLYNRAYFEAELARLEISQDYPIGLIVMDTDNLKQVNDQDGHPAGDALLQRLAHCLKAAFRRSDLVARIGGDEFAVLLPHTDDCLLKNMVDRVTLVLDRHNAAHSDHPLHVSIGAAIGRYGEPLSNVFRRADEAMYREKQWRKATRSEKLCWPKLYSFEVRS